MGTRHTSPASRSTPSCSSFAAGTSGWGVLRKRSDARFDIAKLNPGAFTIDAQDRAGCPRESACVGARGRRNWWPYHAPVTSPAVSKRELRTCVGRPHRRVRGALRAHLTARGFSCLLSTRFRVRRRSGLSDGFALNLDDGDHARLKSQRSKRACRRRRLGIVRTTCQSATGPQTSSATCRAGSRVRFGWHDETDHAVSD